MKEIIPKDSRYVPLVQGKYCCAPTSISMVMLRHGIPLVPQELLGYYLGLTVPKKVQKIFRNARTGKKPIGGYGTQIKKHNPNVAFKKLKIPLEFVYHPISKFNDKTFVDFLEQAVKADKDILVCFDHPSLNKEKGRWGHVCVFDRIYFKRGLVRLVDPSASQPKWRTVKIKDLKRAMDVHGDVCMAGFWEFKKVK